MTALALMKTSAPDPFATVRALNKMRTAGFVVRLAGADLQIAPVARLSDSQRAYLRAHKPALVALLTDAETVYSALVQAGVAGLGWREGTPPDWAGARLLAAGEVLYAIGRMVNRMGRRYRPESAPAIEEDPERPRAAEAPHDASGAATDRGTLADFVTWLAGTRRP